MHGPCPTFPLVAAEIALRRRPPLLLHLEERSVGVGASRNAMTFDAGRAGELLVVDQDHVEEMKARSTTEVKGDLGNGWLLRSRPC